MPFRFGDGRLVLTNQTVTFPAKMVNHLCNIKREMAVYTQQLLFLCYTNDSTAVKSRISS